MPFRMKYSIIQRYLPGPSSRRPKVRMEKCLFLTAHDTGNPGSTAAANVSYFSRTHNEMSASAHLFVDDKEIIECIPFLTGAAEKAHHVIYNVTTDNARFGDDANDAAGGIELCYGGNINLQESYRRYVWVMAYACYKYNLDPAKAIVGHYMLDPARRSDPKEPFRLLGKSFDDFLRDVAEEYRQSLISESGSNPQDNPVIIPPPAPGTGAGQDEVYLNPEDANKLIRFLSAGWFAVSDAKGKQEFNRLANELRRASGQPLQ